MWDAFVKSLKRDDVCLNPLTDAETMTPFIADRIEDYTENHPHSALKWKSFHEFIKSQTETVQVPDEKGDH